MTQWSASVLTSYPWVGGEGSGDENVMRSNSLASNGSRSNSVDDNRQQDVIWLKGDKRISIRDQTHLCGQRRQHGTLLEGLKLFQKAEKAVVTRM
jgi:hypothetical protein